MAKMKYTIDDMRRIAKERGGECLSETYGGGKSHLLWKCNCGNTWLARPDHVILRGHWCRNCRRSIRLKYTIEDMKKIACSRGGECLSETYGGDRMPLLWRCRLGHEWYAIPKKVIHGNGKRKNNGELPGGWCGKCSRKENRSGKLQAGKLQEEINKAANEELLMRKEWRARERKERFLNEARAIAKAMGGLCLSNEYIDTHHKLSFLCAEGHRFDMATHEIKQDAQWCPKCADTAKTERIVRQLFEEMVGKKFPKCRPSFLKNRETGRNFELDGYCKELKFAFEYDGEQHTRCVPQWSVDEIKIAKTKERDKKKDELCKNNGVTLIRVPHNIKVCKLASFIRSELQRVGLAQANKEENLWFWKRWTNKALGG